MSPISYNKLFSDKQYGFIKGRSSTLQLLNMLDSWTNCLEDGGKLMLFTQILKRLSISVAYIEFGDTQTISSVMHFLFLYIFIYPDICILCLRLLWPLSLSESI